MRMRSRLESPAFCLHGLAVVCVFTSLTLLRTSAQENGPVTYVTGCPGRDSVVLQSATSGTDDIRGAFVYKGSDILGSDIIPAQGQYKGRLRISRDGEVVLSNVQLEDSGVYRVETARSSGKTTSQVVLFLPEVPRTEDGELHLRTVLSPDKQKVIRLTCGTFNTRGYPPVQVVWQDPGGRKLSSTGYADGQYYLDITDDSPPGNYSCSVACPTALDTCCLSPKSPLLLRPHTQVAACVTCAPPTPREEIADETTTSSVTPQMASALKKTGEDMAVGMAALVNDQFQDTVKSNNEQLEIWKQSFEEKIETKLQELKQQFEGPFAEGAGEEGRSSEEEPSEVVRARGKSFKFREPLGETPRSRSRSGSEPGTTSMEERIQALGQLVEENRQNMADFQENFSSEMQSIQKKIKSIRRNMKKHGLPRHNKMISDLGEEMNRRFEEVHEKVRNLEVSRAGSDTEAFDRFQATLEEMDIRMNESRTNIDNFLHSVANQIETLQGKVLSLDKELGANRVITVKERPRLVLSEDDSETEDDANDSERKTNSDDKEIATTLRTNQITERTTVTPVRAVFTRVRVPGTTRRPEVDHRFIETPTGDIDFPETCAEAQVNGGTESGAYRLQPKGLEPQPFWCDMDNSGGGWLVIQRRMDGSENFFRPWRDYVQGFGDQSGPGEFWLGLEKLHTITNSCPHSLRVDLRSVDGRQGYAVYRHARVLSRRHLYALAVYGYSGNAGDSLVLHNRPFSTRDKDHDDWVDGHCAKNYRSAWWYAGCRISDLNAPYTGRADGIMWMYGDHVWGAGKIAFAEIKIRPQPKEFH